MTARTPDKSRKIVEDILAGVSVDHFLSDIWNKFPLHIKGREGRFGDLLDWDGLASLIMHHPIEPPRIQIARAGKRIPAERFMQQGDESRNRFSWLDAGSLASLLDKGGNLLVNCIDEIVPRIAALADAMEDVFPAGIGVNLYASWRKDHGLPLHWDYHDVLVIQLAGQKHWSIYAPTRDAPLYGDDCPKPDESNGPDISVHMTDGDAIYVPRGWWHIVKPGDEPAMHLTISLTQSTGAGYLDWLAEDLQSVARLRGAVPAPHDREAKENWLLEARQVVAQAMTMESLDAFLSNERAQRLARPKIEFPHFGRLGIEHWTDATSMRLASTRFLELRPTGENELKVSSGGRSLVCPIALKDSLERLSSAHPTSLDELRAGVPDGLVAELDRMLCLMVEIGIVFASGR